MNEEDVNIAEIVKQSTDQAEQDVPRESMSLRTRALVFLAALIVVASAVTGVYNSVALQGQIDCNQKLTSALNTVADQSRDTNRQLFLFLLEGNHTKAQRDEIRRQYDQNYRDSSIKRQKILDTTCKAGDDVPSPTGSGS